MRCIICFEKESTKALIGQQMGNCHLLPKNINVHLDWNNAKSSYWEPEYLTLDIMHNCITRINSIRFQNMTTSRKDKPIWNDKLAVY
uniref:C2 domain-containing protein n=1 Tax=Heterorhabditis bacteriophora TaxID=37862 RepID=A0A1I7X2H2_HETBA